MTTRKKSRGSVADTTEPSFLTIGKITKPHGVRGEVRVLPLTDTPERFTWLEHVYLGHDDPKLVAVESVRRHKNSILLKLVGYENRTEAEALRGQFLQVTEAEAIPLEEGEYYLFQLEGLLVVTDDGERLGRVVEVIETGANNVFRVSGNRGDVLLPDIDDVVLDINFDDGRMTVHCLPGLLLE